MHDEQRDTNIDMRHNLYVTACVTLFVMHNFYYETL